jgi:hypothetical protein
MTTAVGDGFPNMVRVKKRRRPKRLTTFLDVYWELGRAPGICALTGKSRACVWNWQQAQCFPARYYRVMTDALARQGYVADMRLWNFADHRQEDKSSLDVVAA